MTNPIHVHGHLIRHSTQTYEMAGGGKFNTDSLWEFRNEIEKRNLKLSPGEMYEVKVHPDDWGDFLDTMARNDGFSYPLMGRVGDTYQYMGFRITLDVDQPEGEWHFHATVFDTVEAVL